MSIGLLYFAMVDNGDEFDPDVHCREDLDVFNLVISQSEGEFARAELEVINPREGLLLDTRQVRIFISCERTPGGDKVLMFDGRVTGYPSDLSSEMVTLEYIAQPNDWIETQNDFIQDLKVAPYYNALFIPAENRDDAAEILASRSSLLHWNRATGELSLSDILEGAETITIDEGYFFDSLQTQIGDPPLRTINLNIEAQWNQIGVGTVDVAEQVRLEFTNSAIATEQINTLTPLAFEDGWKGARVPSGYEISESVLTPVADSFGLTQSDLRSSARTVAGADYPTKTGATPATRSVTVPRVWYKGRLKLLAVYEQKRRENLLATVVSTTQEYNLRSNISEDLFIRLEDPVANVNGAILDPSLPSFFYDVATEELSTFGDDVIQHALLRCRARLAKTIRAVETSIEAKIDDVLDITCDHSLRLVDDRLPGQMVYGKVVGYRMEFDGDTGRQLASVTIASAIGTGFSSEGSEVAGEESIEETEYVTLGDFPTMTSEVFYNLEEAPDLEIPIDVSLMESDDSYLVDGVVVTDDGETQNAGWAGSSTPDIYLQDHRTGVTVTLKSMNPEPELAGEVDLVVQVVTWPKQVDLGTVLYDMLTEDDEQLLQETGELLIA